MPAVTMSWLVDANSISAHPTEMVLSVQIFFANAKHEDPPKQGAKKEIDDLLKDVSVAFVCGIEGNEYGDGADIAERKTISAHLFLAEVLLWPEDDVDSDAERIIKKGEG